MDYSLERATYNRSGGAALPAVDTRPFTKEYKKVSPVRAELRAAVAWAK